jgi:hypothetical protein
MLAKRMTALTSSREEAHFDLADRVPVLQQYFQLQHRLNGLTFRCSQNVYLFFAFIPNQFFESLIAYLSVQYFLIFNNFRYLFADEKCLTQKNTR